MRITVFDKVGYRTMELSSPLTASQNWAIRIMEKSRSIVFHGRRRSVTHVFVLDACPERLWTFLDSSTSVLYPIVLKAGDCHIEEDMQRMFTGSQFNTDLSSRVVHHNSRLPKQAIRAVVHL